jgi:AraC family transcriptional regulator of adaptative response/methylated-DNA-[protein]-cysteine methyltransferase
LSSDYDRIGAALRFIEDNAQAQPDLNRIAAQVGLSPHHFQRLFKRWVGISPKRFLQFLTLQQAKRSLAASRSVLDASYDAGLSSPGRLHDLFVTLEGVTPGEFGAGGRGVEIRYGRHRSPFGHCLLARTERGICALSFHDEADCSEGLERVAGHWPRSRLREDRRGTKPVADALFADPGNPSRPRLSLHLKGSNFQVKVWEALMRLEPGQLCAYGDIARVIGRPGAARAVGRAVSGNPIAWLIPCHRVIRSLGAFGGYRWGSERKRAMIGWELAKMAAPELEP